MIKHIVIVLSFSIIMQASAMEIQPTIDDKKLCYLALMPFVVQNLILSFVKDDETEEEFIVRTKNVKEPQYSFCELNEFLSHAKNMFKENYENAPFRFRCGLQLSSFCPDFSRFVLIQLLYGNDVHSTLTLVDAIKKEAYHSELFDKGDYTHCALSQDDYTHCALSQGTNMIALIAKRDNSPFARLCCWQDNILVIKNLVTQKKLEQKIYCIDEIFSVAFNTQGTHVIVHEKVNSTIGTKHEIFRIEDMQNKFVKKIDMLLDIDFTQKTPFQQYLIERRVCKSLDSSILPFTLSATQWRIEGSG